MALIKCLECGRQYSERADNCPSCGCPNDLKIAMNRFNRAEDQRINSIIQCMEMYKRRIIINIIVTLIGWIIGYSLYKWKGNGVLINLFVFVVFAYWCQIIIIKYKVEFFIACIMIAIILGISVLILNYLPKYFLDVYAICVLLITLYSMFITPILNFYRMQKQKELL